MTLFPVLGERRRQPGGALSGGEQQMLAMGRALLARPRLLVVDEPFMGLSPLYVDHIFDILQELNRDGIGILLVEQNANMALSIAARGRAAAGSLILLSIRATNICHETISIAVTRGALPNLRGAVDLFLQVTDPKEVPGGRRGHIFVTHSLGGASVDFAFSLGAKSARSSSSTASEKSDDEKATSSCSVIVPVTDHADFITHLQPCLS